MYLTGNLTNLEKWKAKKRAANTSYTNVPLPNDDDLPLPPQPLAYSPPENQSEFPDPPKDLTPPPPGSPGNSSIYAGPASSSSYATYRPHSSNNQEPDFCLIHTFKHLHVNRGLSAREKFEQFTKVLFENFQSSYDTGSIYEPINPRPSSQMSNRSTYSSASGLSSLYSAGSYYPNRSRIATQSGISPVLESDHLPTVGKEAEVDHLTDLLVQSMENSADPEFFGMCYKCGQTVLGEGSGCTAMGQVYHIKCFTCHVCHKELRGISFYSMDGKPYCEEDYLNTLEKCCVCTKPILDRILRATGKPYHPDCFTCVICGKCLDGIPFTVDSGNRIHCIEDFHRKFAPRCCVCKNPIMPEPGQQETVRIVALDRSFHVNCYKCEDCGLILSSEAEGRGCYPLDDHILCRNCNARRVQQLTATA
ncbi:lipoma-preferred partner-like protein [Dinothrombium tinctorium]|uniref:Lipoma-preferred partner-like protein n=1 Tax=Dinothrombium tinctorium TaxID=1965070 RepID=A0A3S4RFI7_9ACAR|nr:lipoma-preferred partner-like protein [Dinothrombium tinctorium]RWS12020.1 lipoma-preferred partner-like protein [Dinothrombium tinctorium]RWS12023.1 lipoma-preferred partner-like protein [Dinothrombium tinctorium]RWS15564.1 lipoma-preferred partner-like protein [Dinothrombium tinctorium]